MISLFPDQLELVNKARAELAKGHKRILVQAETGFGKTIVGSYLIKSANAKGNKCAFQVPRKDLLRQTKETWKKFDIPHSQVAAGHFYAPDSTNHLCSMMTFVKRLDQIDPDIIFLDECHFGATTMDNIINYWSDRGKIIIGLSATPEKPNGHGMADWFDTMVCGPSLRWLIDNNRLSDYRMFSVGNRDYSHMPKSNGEYVKKPMTKELMNDKALVGDVVEHYKKHAMGKRHMTFCYSIEHSKMMAHSFNAAGVPSAHMDGDTPDSERRRIIADYADGKLMNLCTVDILLFGFDLSAQVGRDVPVESMSDCRPTQSTTTQRQKNGRVLRYKDYPALIFDHVGNAHIHGLPCDEKEWTLEGKKKRKKQEAQRAAPMKTCDVCFFCHPPAPECPSCGFKYPHGGRDLEEVEGELEEIKRQEFRKAKKREEGMCRTLEDWQELAKERGYNRGWAFHRYNARKGK